jgi:hypothetical protein
MLTLSDKGLQLVSLREDKCPICGTHVVIEESVEVEKYGCNPKVREHVNGGKWEHRKFICGLVLSYIPNFGMTEINKYYTCKNDPTLIERNKKREELKEEILMFISQSGDVDDAFKKRLYDNVNNTYIS